LDNPAPGKVLLKANMTLEGHLLDHYKIGEKYKNVNLYGLTLAAYNNQIND
jgi:RimJ/RimL family protein N-acetyltransferase